MYRTQGVLALLALCVGLSHSFSWDLVLAKQKQLEFYDNKGILSHTEVILTDKIRSIAYDPVHSRVLFADRISSYHSISSFDIATRNIQSLVRSGQDEYSQIAYDPATQLLFWVDHRSDTINSILTKPGSNNTVNRNLIHFDGDVFRPYIAVDSCGGHIYWTTSTDTRVERARFDGSEREVVIDEKVYLRGAVAIDQQTQMMYWIEWLDKQNSTDDNQMSIESADLTAKNRRTLYRQRNHYRRTTLTVSKDFIYWSTQNSYWILSQDPPSDGVVEHIEFSLNNVVGIATNYNIEEQDCETLKSLLPINSVPSDFDSLNNSIDVSLFCVHGTKVSGEARCECTQGYIGERCDVSVCHNYCFQGDCSVSADGQPKCRCNTSYSGERCEVKACHEYCLNNGVCSLNEESEPVCKCTGHYEGERCDVPIFLVKCFQTVSMLRDILNTDVTPGTLGKGVMSTCAPTAV